MKWKATLCFCHPELNNLPPLFHWLENILTVIASRIFGTMHFSYGGKNCLMHYADDVTVYTSKLWRNIKLKYTTYILQLWKSLPYTLYIVSMQGQNTNNFSPLIDYSIQLYIGTYIGVLLLAAAVSHILYFLRVPVILCSLLWILYGTVSLPTVPTRPHTHTPSPLLSLPANQRCSANTLQLLWSQRSKLRQNDIPPLLFSYADYYEKRVTILESASVTQWVH